MCAYKVSDLGLRQAVRQSDCKQTDMHTWLCKHNIAVQCKGQHAKTKVCLGTVL